MLIWLMSHLYALPRRARQHDKWVAFAVIPALCLSAFFLPPQAWPSRPSTWPDRNISRGHEARPETDDMRHPAYQIGTNIRRTYSAARVVRQEAESHSVTNAGRAPPCEIRRYGGPVHDRLGSAIA